MHKHHSSALSAGEYLHKITQTIRTEETQKSPADLADLRRQNPKTAKLQQLQQPQTTCLSLRNNTACCIPLRYLRYLRENIHARVLNLLAQMKPQCLTQITQIYADKTPKQQNSLNLKQTVFLCEIIQLSCIHLRNLRNLRENIHARVLNLLAQMKPHKSHADHADNRRQNPNSNNLMNLKQPVFLCEIMQLAAFLCVICAICGRIITQEYSIETPKSPADLADKPQNQTNYNLSFSAK